MLLNVAPWLVAVEIAPNVLQKVTPGLLRRRAGAGTRRGRMMAAPPQPVPGPCGRFVDPSRFARMELSILVWITLHSSQEVGHGTQELKARR